MPIVAVDTVVAAIRATREARLAAREAPDFLRQWHARWDLVEEYYFGHVRPPLAFDVVLQTDGVSA